MQRVRGDREPAHVPPRPPAEAPPPRDGGGVEPDRERERHGAVPSQRTIRPRRAPPRVLARIPRAVPEEGDLARRNDLAPGRPALGPRPRARAADRRGPAPNLSPSAEGWRGCPARLRRAPRPERRVPRPRVRRRAGRARGARGGELAPRDRPVDAAEARAGSVDRLRGAGFASPHVQAADGSGRHLERGGEGESGAAARGGGGGRGGGRGVGVRRRAREARRGGRRRRGGGRGEGEVEAGGTTDEERRGEESRLCITRKVYEHQGRPGTDNKIRPGSSISLGCCCPPRRPSRAAARPAVRFSASRRGSALPPRSSLVTVVAALPGFGGGGALARDREGRMGASSSRPSPPLRTLASRLARTRSRRRRRSSRQAAADESARPLVEAGGGEPPRPGRDDRPRSRGGDRAPRPPTPASERDRARFPRPDASPRPRPRAR